MFAGNIKAVGNKMWKDICKIWFITNIIAYSILLVMNVLLGIDKRESIMHLICYGVLFVGTAIMLILFLTKTKRKSGKFVRVLRIVDYVAHTVIIVFSITDILKYGTNDLNKIVVIINILFLLVKIVVEIIKFFAESYAKLLWSALNEDFKIIGKLEKISEVKGNFFEMLDAPLEFFANKIQGKEKESTPQQETVKELREEFEEDLKEKKILKKEKKKQKKEDHKKRSAERAEEQKKEICEHWKVIKSNFFKKKNK